LQYLRQRTGYLVFGERTKVPSGHYINDKWDR
jgi:hypothetical protein